MMGEEMDKVALELVGMCGFYCGSCPAYRTGECEGCRKAHSQGGCFTAQCVKGKGLIFCSECIDFPCDQLLVREKATVLDKKWLAWMRGRINQRT